MSEGERGGGEDNGRPSNRDDGGRALQKGGGESGREDIKANLTDCSDWALPWLGNSAHFFLTC